MVSQTSGISTFDLDIADVMEDAYERVGRELRSGYDAITARRSLNILLQELTNRGIHLWTVELNKLPLFPGQPQYQLPDDTADVLPDAAIRRLNAPTSTTLYFDFPCTRWQRDQYLAMPTKTQPGRPYYFLIERLRDNPQLTFWPVPDRSSDVLLYWRIRYLQDLTDSTQNPDMPRRFLPVLVSGLAYYIANKAPDVVDVQRRGELREDYELQLKLALAEDHDRAATILTPQLRRR